MELHIIRIVHLLSGEVKGNSVKNNPEIVIDDDDEYFNLPEYTIVKSARVVPPAFTVKSSRTYKDYFNNVFKKAIPSPATSPIQIEIVNDQYFKLSTKVDTRLSRAEGEESRRIHLSGFDQLMPQGDQWHNLFNNKDNNEDLISLAVSIFKSDEGRRLLNYPFIINSKEETWKITRQTVQLLQRCNHEEA